MDHDELVEPVRRFIDEVTPGLEQISRVVAGLDGDDRRTVVNEAFALTAACIDVDGLHTDEELFALQVAFGAHVDTLLPYARPRQVRDAGLVDGKRSWLNGPSLLFDVLVRGDAKLATSFSWTYYERAMAIAYAVASLDDVPSHAELAALDRFRTMLLRTRELAGITGGPGSPRANGNLPASAGSDSAAVPADDPLPPKRPLEELLAELDALVGLSAVKAEVKLVANLIKVQSLRRERGLPVPETSHHVVFTGNPGTGKTTVARLLAQIYRTLGVLEKGHLVETDRSGLVAGYVGQTAIQVRQVVEKAMGGMLLIDEAYALARGDQRDFGQEAIDTLVKLIEDRREDFAVVAAGYPDEMHDFIESNPGLRSRFPKTIHFPDYATAELVAIFESLGKKSAYSLTPAAKTALVEFFEAQPRDKGFGNARLARNLFEAAVANHASRVVGLEDPTDAQLCELVATDVAPPRL
ncbi:MAG TPA: AAA family ATPase [Acidimicrobiales bacterium]|nr:AAA family ATPase [Acidimicrobiales bacterium]